MKVYDGARNKENAMTKLTSERLDEIEERLSASYMKRASSLTMENLDVIALVSAARANAKLVEALTACRGQPSYLGSHALEIIDAALEAAGVKP